MVFETPTQIYSLPFANLIMLDFKILRLIDQEKY